MIGDKINIDPQSKCTLAGKILFSNVFSAFAGTYANLASPFGAQANAAGKGIRGNLMATVPIHEQALVQGGNSVFEDVWITDTLHYDFKRSGNVEFNSLSVSGTSSFTGDVTFAGSLFALDLSLSRNANVSGISTVKEIFVDGKLRDGDGNFGSSGQLLSSDGTDLVWINANTTSVANATNVGVNLNSDNFESIHIILWCK